MAKIEPTSVDVTFDAFFKAPAFSLAQQNVATLKALHGREMGLPGEAGDGVRLDLPVRLLPIFG